MSTHVHSMYGFAIEMAFSPALALATDNDGWSVASAKTAGVADDGRWTLSINDNC